MADRLIGRARGEAPGPSLIVVGGIHGNEPAGVDAALRVLDRLGRDQVQLRGEFLALRGNVRALAEKRRYLARDLNRQWAPERQLPAAGASADPEALERDELGRALDEAIAAARG